MINTEIYWIFKFFFQCLKNNFASFYWYCDYKGDVVVELKGNW